MPSLLTRRCVMDNKTHKNMYDTIVEEAEAMGGTNLANHIFGETFFRSEPDFNGNIYYEKSDGNPLVVNFIGEIGSPAQGTHMAASPKNHPPASKLPYNDANSKSHKMVLGLRCPTNAPPELCGMFRNAVAACDGVRAADEDHEKEHNQKFEVTDWIICARGDEEHPEKMSLLARLQQTYEVDEVPAQNGGGDSSGTPRKRITRVISAAETTEVGNEDVGMEGTQLPRERQVGDKYPPDVLPDHRGSYFAHDKAQLVQRDYRDVDGSLIAPYELYEKLVEGTLVLVTASLVTYIITGQTTERGAPKSDKKVYHILVDQLKILDHGDGEAWNPPVPSVPERRLYSPATPKRARDPAADAVFNNFGSKTPSPAKRSKRGKST
ncbi:hypothetical protein B0H14DRAFT_3691970 [Mycena olivaceomarginata]|nr:hypothetical protein B0H14DRAFT_3691970 [Mycena olivaceomarginata]